MCRTEQRFLNFFVALFLVLATLTGCAPSIDFSHIRNIHTAGGVNIVCFGDSLTSGMGADPGGDYPSILREELDLPVINSGRSGDTTFTAIERIKSDILDNDPKIVIVELGANDYLVYGSSQVPSRTTKDTFLNLEQIVESIEEHGSVVVVAGIPFNPEYKKGYQDLARKKGAVLIPDIMKGILGRRELMTLDRIHPNGAGYRVMAENILSVLKPLLKEMEGR